jgi:hypothetical protein
VTFAGVSQGREFGGEDLEVFLRELGLYLVQIRFEYSVVGHLRARFGAVGSGVCAVGRSF